MVSFNKGGYVMVIIYNILVIFLYIDFKINFIK